MKRSILIIDDDIIYSTIIYKLLCPQYSISLAQDSIEAISLINEKIPSLVIADLNLPGIEGAELIEIIRKKLNSDIPIIVISGMDHDYLQKELFQLGISEFLTKPINRITLKEKIADLIQ